MTLVEGALRFTDAYDMGDREKFPATMKKSMSPGRRSCTERWARISAGWGGGPNHIFSADLKMSGTNDVRGAISVVRLTRVR